MPKDNRPIAIWHQGDADAYYASTPAEQDAWNAYAQAEADAFDNDPHRDTYDSTAVFPGWDREGNCTPWCPPLFFPEWLAKHNANPTADSACIGARTRYGGDIETKEVVMDHSPIKAYRPTKSSPKVFLKEPQKFVTAKKPIWADAFDLVCWALLAAAVVTIAVKWDIVAATITGGI